MSSSSPASAHAGRSSSPRRARSIDYASSVPRSPPTPPRSSPSLPSIPSHRASKSPANSETTHVHRRPRSPPRCVCPPISTTATASSQSGSRSGCGSGCGPGPSSASASRARSAESLPALPGPPLPSLGCHHPAISFASLTSLTCLSASAISAAARCRNASLLSSILASVISELDEPTRTFWCQMMDTLAMRTRHGDVKYSISIAPYLPWHAEDAYAQHSRSLIRPNATATRKCPVCHAPARTPAKKPRTSRSSPLRTYANFAWVEDEDDSLDERGSTQSMPVASFESYVCDVLDDAGKHQFIRERFYGGNASLNSRYLLAKFGDGLDMHPQELQRRQAELAAWESQSDAESEQEGGGSQMSDGDAYHSNISDTESLNRSDNGAF